MRRRPAAPPAGTPPPESAIDPTELTVADRRFIKYMTEIALRMIEDEGNVTASMVDVDQEERRR